VNHIHVVIFLIYRKATIIIAISSSTSSVTGAHKTFMRHLMEQYVS
jgi:hypothetical protein